MSARPRLRVRFISTFEPATTFYRDLLPHLAAAGIDVEVILSRTTYRGGRSRLRDAVAGSGVRVIETPGPATTARGTTAKVAAMLGLLVTATTRTLLERGVDVNAFFSTPPFFALWGIVLRAVRHQPYLCIVQDVYPDVLVADGRLAPGSLTARVLGLLTRISWRQADGVVVIGRCMADLVTAAGVSPERIQLIHNWTPEEDAEPLPIGTSELREELDLVGRFVVLYSGNLGVTHTFDEVLAVAAGSDVAEDAVFVFIGDGARKAEVERAASSISPTRIRSVPFQPPERLHQSLALADVHLVTLRPGFEGVVVPSKAYGAMGSGRPVIYVGDERGEIARVIHEESAGLVVAPGDADGLARAVEHYRTNPEAQRLDGGRAARVARGRLGRDAAMDAWTTMLVSRFATRSED